MLKLGLNDSKAMKATIQLVGTLLVCQQRTTRLKVVFHRNKVWQRLFLTIINNIKPWVGAMTGKKKSLLTCRSITSGLSGFLPKCINTNLPTKIYECSGGVISIRQF